MLRRLALAFVLAPPAAAGAATYDIDPVHSEVGFKVQHMIVGRVPGKFKKFTGTFEYDGKKPGDWKAEAVIETASIDTGNEKRDAHLRSPDFFDAEKHPTLTFVSTSLSGWKKGRGKLLGKLTIRGVTKYVVLDLVSNGELADPQGYRAGFTATTTIDRRDFGIVWNRTLDVGGLALSNEVDVTLEIEGIRREDGPAKK